jgi:hypothetical protein
VGTGVAGASLFVAATGAGYFDAERNDEEIKGLKEQFLTAWNRQAEADKSTEGNLNTML